MCNRDHGLETFYEVGKALLEIRDQRLYRAAHGTFEEYCRERWNLGRRYANQVIAAAGVVENLGAIAPKPTTESQVRPLTDLAPEDQRTVWDQAVRESNGPASSRICLQLETFSWPIELLERNDERVSFRKPSYTGPLISGIRQVRDFVDVGVWPTPDAPHNTTPPAWSAYSYLDIVSARLERERKSQTQ